MWVTRVTDRTRPLAARAVVQLTKKGSYLSVQDKFGGILATAKWDRRLSYQDMTDFLRAEKLYPSEWRSPRPGLYVTYVRDIALP